MYANLTKTSVQYHLTVTAPSTVSYGSQEVFTVRINLFSGCHADILAELGLDHDRLTTISSSNLSFQCDDSKQSGPSAVTASLGARTMGFRLILPRSPICKTGTLPSATPFRTMTCLRDLGRYSSSPPRATLLRRSPQSCGERPRSPQIRLSRLSRYKSMKAS